MMSDFRVVGVADFNREGGFSGVHEEYSLLPHDNKPLFKRGWVLLDWKNRSVTFFRLKREALAALAEREAPTSALAALADKEKKEMLNDY